MDPFESGLIISRREARQVIEHHSREQEQYSQFPRRPQMWVTLSDPRSLVVIVETSNNGHHLNIPYQYEVKDHVLEEVQKMIERPIKEPKDPVKPVGPKPLRQLHAFGPQ